MPIRRDACSRRRAGQACCLRSPAQQVPAGFDCSGSACNIKPWRSRASAPLTRLRAASKRKRIARRAVRKKGAAFALCPSLSRFGEHDRLSSYDRLPSCACYAGGDSVHCDRHTFGSCCVANVDRDGQRRVNEDDAGTLAAIQRLPLLALLE